MRRPTRILTLSALVPFTVLALAACTQGGPLPLLTPSAASSATPTPSATPRTSAAAIAGVALREVGQGTVVSVESESDGSLWDVLVIAGDGTEQELHLDTDGRVVAGPSADSTDADDESDNRALVAAADVSLATAAKRAAAAVPDGTLTAIELDEDDDQVAWRTDVTDAHGVRHDVRIDAVDGSVLSDRADSAASSAATTGATGGS